MSDLTVYNNDGIELVINTETGEAFATQNGYARMSGKDKSTISRRVRGLSEGVAQSCIIMAEIQTSQGLQGVALIPANVVFEWLVYDNPELAVKMGQAGATLYMHQLAGYKKEQAPPIAQPLELPPADVRMKDLRDTLDYFGISIDNPRYKQGLQDLVLNTLGVTQPSLPITPSEVWLGVAERAEQLGYPTQLVVKYRRYVLT